MHYGIILKIAVVLVFTAGCAPTWNSARSYPGAHQQYTTVDIVPIDIQFATSKKHRGNAQSIFENTIATIESSAFQKLTSRGKVVQQLNWDGSFRQQTSAAVSPEVISDTVASLSAYGAAVNTQKQLIPAYLPHRLGTTSNSDATLYVGGWTFVGKKDGSNTGKTVLAVIAVALIVVVIAAVAAKALSKSSGGKSSSVKTPRSRNSGTSMRNITGAKRPTVAGKITETARGGSRSFSGFGPRRGVNLNVFFDAAVAADSHVSYYGQRPAYKPANQGKKSRMYLEATLVSNKNGSVLWHAQQKFPAHAANANEVEKAMTKLLANLPR